MYHRTANWAAFFRLPTSLLPKQVLDTEKPRSVNSWLTQILRLHFYERFFLAAQIRHMRFVWNCLHALNRLFDAIVSLIRKHEAIWISRNNFHNFMHTQSKPCVTTSKCRFVIVVYLEMKTLRAVWKRDATRQESKKAFVWRKSFVGKQNTSEFVT